MDEEDRRVIFEALERAHGPEVAGRMMAYMPMVPWRGLATKADLTALEQRITKGMGDRFDRVDERFDRVEAPLGRVDERFDRVDERFDRVEAPLGRVEARFGRVEARFGRVDERFDRVDERFAEASVRTDDRFAQVNSRFDQFESRFLAELGASEQRLTAVFRGELLQAVTMQSRTMLLTMLGAVLTFGALLLAAMRMS